MTRAKTLLMMRTERSMLLDAIVLYESIKELLPEKDREMWERWKQLALEILYPENAMRSDITEILEKHKAKP
jgi:hypothetical protein